MQPVERIPATQPAPVALVDLLDRVLATGVVVSGEVTLAVAGVDLVRVSLLALLASVHTAAPQPQGAQLPGPDRTHDGLEVT